MSNEEKAVVKEENVYERLWKLWTMICKMVMDGARDPNRVAEVLQNIVNEVAVEVKVYLRKLLEVPIGATDGTETFASSGLFTGGIYGLTLPAGSGKPTLATKATVWKIILNGIFAQIFGSLGERRGRWTESQVVAFSRDHRDKLRTEGYATFFEIEGGFVVSVLFDGDGQLRVYVYEFSFVDTWSARFQHRLVSPKLNVSPSFNWRSFLF